MDASKMEEFQMNLIKHLSSLTPSQLSQLTPQQMRDIAPFLTQVVAKQAQLKQQQQQQQQQNQKNQQNNVINQQQQLQNQLQQQLQQQELARLQQLQQQQNQIPLSQQQLVLQQLSQNTNFSSSYPPTLVPPRDQANLYAYGFVTQPISANVNGQVNLETKYKQLLAVIDEMSKDIRSLYSGSKTSVERFKRLITQAKLLVKECLIDVNSK